MDQKFLLETPLWINRNQQVIITHNRDSWNKSYMSSAIGMMIMTTFTYHAQNSTHQWHSRCKNPITVKQNFSRKSTFNVPNINKKKQKVYLQENRWIKAFFFSESVKKSNNIHRGKRQPLPYCDLEMKAFKYCLKFWNFHLIFCWL